MDLLHRLAPPHAVLAPALWAIAFYGVMLGAWPVIVANFITLALAACILTMKIVLGRGGGR